jgi:polyisoprenoid-binding protein YceI
MRHLLATTALAFSLISSAAFAAPEKYAIDQSHTNVLFFIDHLGFSQTVGRFDDVNGTLVLDEQDPEKSSVDVLIKASSVNTQSADLNKHLQAKDWFDSATYPDIKFVSRSVKKTGADTADVTGDLTLHGVTKSVTLKTKLNKADYFEMAKAWVAGFNAETTIKRSEFGISNYVPMVGDEVKILISTEFHNKEKAAPAKGAEQKK